MIVTPFLPGRELILIKATVWNRRGQFRQVDLALDTGASETLLVPEVTDALGYGARDALARTVIRSAIGDEPGYLLRVARFSALGFEIPDVRLHVHDLPEGYGIEGLLGLDFLQRFDYAIKSIRGELHVDWATDAAPSPT